MGTWFIASLLLFLCGYVEYLSVCYSSVRLRQAILNGNYTGLRCSYLSKLLKLWNTELKKI